MSANTETRLRNLTKVLGRADALLEKQRRLENQAREIAGRMCRFEFGDRVIFEGEEWEVCGLPFKFIDGVAHVWIRLRRGGSKINPSKTRYVPVRKQSECRKKK